jgi:hypothetical protein
VSSSGCLWQSLYTGVAAKAGVVCMCVSGYCRNIYFHALPVNQPSLICDVSIAVETLLVVKVTRLTSKSAR